MSHPRLAYGVPKPFLTEAPSAWLTRLVAAQGCTVAELMNHLDLDPRKDLDWLLLENGFSGLRRQCGLGVEDFHVAERVLSGLQRARVEPAAYLRRSETGRATFAYCPRCMAARGECHLHIHWRFLDWRYCPLHHCLLERTCPRCAEPLAHPRSLVGSIAGRQGHASLRRCLDCVGSFDHHACPVSDGPVSVLDQQERCWLQNGRALIAGLYSGHFRIGATRYELESLSDLHDRGVLPTRYQWSRVERRLRSVRRSS